MVLVFTLTKDTEYVVLNEQQDPDRAEKKLVMFSDVVTKALTMHNTPDLGLQCHELTPKKRMVEASERP